MSINKIDIFRLALDFMSLSTHTNSLILQAIGRIGSCGSQGLQADCEQSHCQAERGGEKEYPYLDVGPVGELLKPFPHGEIGDGPSDEVSGCYALKELLVEEGYDTGC